MFEYKTHPSPYKIPCLPYEAMLFLCDEYVLKKLNCHYIKPDEVILNDSLLK